MIEFPPVYDTLTTEQQKIVVEHELMHIPVDEKHHLVPHDVGEFKVIIDKYGLDWFETFKKVSEKVKLLKEKEKLEKKERKIKEKK